MQRRLSARQLTAFVATALTGVWPSLPAMAEGQPYFAKEAQVRLVDGVSIETINGRYGTASIDSIPPLYLLSLPDSGGELQWVDRLQSDPDIAEAECSWMDETPEGVRQMVVVVVGDSIEDYLDQDLIARLHLSDVHEQYRGRGVLAAVLDTGIMTTHEALAGSIAPGGWDFVADDGDPSEENLGLDEDGDGMVDEGAGHGTMVAGILHLAAPDAQILPIRVLDDEGRGRVFDVAKGIHYAVEKGAQVINLSLGLLQHSSIIQDQILWASQHSVAIVAAAGNLSASEPPYYPAIDPQTLSVAALDSCDIKADFSNWHRTVDISAPGVGILAPYVGGGYAIGAGTSFSVPFVTAQCAWILEANPEIQIADLYRNVQSGVVDIYQIPENDLYWKELGSGRIDGLMALDAIFGVSDLLSGEFEPRGASLSIHPNPVCGGGSVTVRLVGGNPADGSRILVYSVDGRLIGSADLPKTGVVELPHRIFSGEPASGIYFISLANGRKSVAQFIRIR